MALSIAVSNRFVKPAKTNFVIVRSNKMEKKDDIPQATVVPAVQTMKNAREALATCSGVVVNQKTQLDEAVIQALTGLPFERKNKYKVAALPAGKTVMQSKSDPNGWRPTNAEMDELPQLLFGMEQSSCIERCCLGILGCQNLRNLRMPFVASPTVPASVLEKDLDPESISFTAVRHFGLGGDCCCPFTTDLEVGGSMVGKVEEDFHCGKNWCSRCFSVCCLCTRYFDIIEGEEAKYQLLVNQACFGPHNNCCAPSCCFRNALFNIYDKKNQEVVGQVHRAFGADCNVNSGFRCCFDFSNYLVSFPENASTMEKGLIMAAVVNTEYVFFENTGE